MRPRPAPPSAPEGRTRARHRIGSESPRPIDVVRSGATNASHVPVPHTTSTNNHHMGLLTIIRKNKRKEREMRVLFLGLDNAGKTTILKRLKGQDVMSTSPTLGFEISTLTHGKYLLNIWDVGGQRTLRPYWRNYFEQTDVLVWVVDSGDRLRMNDCREELHALLQEQRLAGASLLVFANKQDITGSMTDAEIKTALGLPSIRSHRWRIQACSAFTGENVHAGLEWAVSEVAQRVYWGVLDGDPPNSNHASSARQSLAVEAT